MASVKPKKRQADMAYERIRDAIMDGEYRTGYPLVETELSEQLNMSRTPIREAMQKLHADRLVEIVPRKGNYVRSVDRQEIKEVYEIQEGLEGMATYLLAVEGPEKGVKKLAKCVRDMEESLETGDIDSWLFADAQFHVTLYEYCGNKTIAEILKRMNNQINIMRFTITRLELDKGLSTEEHKATLHAIQNKDGNAARQITQMHMSRVRKEIISHFL